MRDRPYKIMLVESDPATIEVLAGSLGRRFRATITCAADAKTCLDMELVEPHDLTIIDVATAAGTTGSHRALPGGLRLVQHLRSLSLRPVLLMIDRPTYHDAVTAMRAGVRDIFKKPFAVEHLLDAAQQALRESDLSQLRATKYRRMREMVRHVIRERRALSRRVELICRDLVQAQRNLLHRVAAFEDRRAKQPGSARSLSE